MQNYEKNKTRRLYIKDGRKDRNGQNVGFETVTVIYLNQLLPRSGAELAETRVFVFGRVRGKKY